MQQSSSLSDCQERLLCPPAYSPSRVSQCTKLFPGNAAYSKSGSVPGLVLASWQCQDYRTKYLWFRRRPKGKQKSLIQERVSKVKADAKYGQKRAEYNEVLERSVVQAWIFRRAAATRCFELRSQEVGRELKGPVGWSDTDTFCLIW